MPPEAATSTGESNLPSAPAAEQSGADLPRVLLVDDDPAIRASLTFSLELEGFEVGAFSTAEEAAGAAIAESNCLIIDYRLPGMDGLALLALLRRRGIQAPAIVITSNPGRALRDAIARSGAALIEKPLLCDALTAEVREKLAACGRA